MNTYDNDNYDAIYDSCWGAADEFGAHAVDMIEVFSGPPSFEAYSPDSDETKAIQAYYSLNAELGGETFFMVNKEGKEVTTPTLKWINS